MAFIYRPEFAEELPVINGWLISPTSDNYYFHWCNPCQGLVRMGWASPWNVISCTLRREIESCAKILDDVP